jgi:hypothetical protein
VGDSLAWTARGPGDVREPEGEKPLSKRRGGAQVKMSAVTKVTLPAVTCRRASAIISGAASTPVTVTARPARWPVHIPVPQPMCSRSLLGAAARPGRQSAGRRRARPSGGYLVLGGPGAVAGDLLLPRHRRHAGSVAQPASTLISNPTACSGVTGHETSPLILRGGAAREPGPTACTLLTCHNPARDWVTGAANGVPDRSQRHVSLVGAPG